MQLTSEPTDNPDQRIAEDMNKFVEEAIKLSLGFLEAVVTLASFVGHPVGAFRVPSTFRSVARNYELYGYMVWVAVALCLHTAPSSRTSWGGPLIKLRFDQQRYEADFRFGLARFRENMEGVALYRGEADELAQGFGKRFGRRA